MPNRKIVHLHNYRCDGKIIQAIMKQNGGWPYEVDGEKGASFFLHLIMFQKEYGIEPTGYFLAGSKSEDQLFALADGKHKNITGARHLGEAFVHNDLRFGNPSQPDKWQVPEADKAKIVKLIHALAVTFDFPDIEIKDEEIELTPDGKVIFEPVMSIKYWLQKDGSISEDYPLSVHHRLNSAFTNAGFKVLEASPKGVRVESISKYEGMPALGGKDNLKLRWLPNTDFYYSIISKQVGSLETSKGLSALLPEDELHLLRLFLLKFHSAHKICLTATAADVSMSEDYKFKIQLRTSGVKWLDMKSGELKDAMPKEVMSHLVINTPISDDYNFYMSRSNKLIWHVGKAALFADILPRDVVKRAKALHILQDLLKLDDERDELLKEFFGYIHELEGLKDEIAQAIDDVNDAKGGSFKVMTRSYQVAMSLKDVKYQSKKGLQKGLSFEKNYKRVRRFGVSGKGLKRVFVFATVLRVTTIIDNIFMGYELIVGISKNIEFVNRFKTINKKMKDVEGMLLKQEENIQNKISVLKSIGGKIPVEGIND